MLLPLGTWGDVLPFVRLGRELKRRGHVVTLVACELFEPLARRESFEFVPIMDCGEYQRIFANPQLWHPRWAAITFLRDAVLPFMRRQFEVIRAAELGGECDLLVAPCQSLGARVAQESLGLPLATVHLAPYMFRSAVGPRKVSGASLPDWLPIGAKRAMFRLADFCGDQSFGRVVNRFRTELGLAPTKRVFWEWWNSPEKIIGLFPEWFGAPQSDWPQQTALAGFLTSDLATVSPLTDEVESFLDAGPAPIVFTAGTAMAHGRQYFEESVRAARMLGARAILLSQYGDQMPRELPAGMIAVDFVPLERLLRRAAAIVHHGGIGTTSQALSAGVPQVPVPMSFDQPDNAHRVECLGVGRSLARRKYSADAVAPLLAEMLKDSEVRARCREVAARCAGSQAVGVACDEIEALALVAEATRRTLSGSSSVV